MTQLPAENAARPIARWQQAVPIWAGRILQAAGVWSVLAYVVRPLFPRASFVVANLFELIDLPGQPNLFNGVLLLMVGAALRHRKRVAMWGVIIWFEISAPLSFIAYGLASIVTGENLWDALSEGLQPGVHRAIPSVHGGWSGHAIMWWDLAVSVTAVASIVVLLLARRAFSARMERSAWWRALAILGAGISLSTAVGFLLTMVWPGHLTSMWQRLVWSAGTAVGFGPRDFTFNSVPLRGPSEITFLITMISALSLFAAIAEFTRSASVKRLATPADELAVRRLLLECGDDDSLGYFATRRDKSVVFSPNGRAAIAYRVINSTVLASGDPIGHPDSWQAAIDLWRKEARTFGWAPAVVAASPAGARAYEAMGFRSLSMGDEAVISVDDFSLAGPAMRGVRAEVARAERAGYRALVRQQRDIAPTELIELGRAAQAWRFGETERGFSMASGRFGDPTDGSAVVVVAYDDAGQPRGLLTFVPWGRRGLSLDLMRRHPHAVGGVTELMVTTLLRAAPDMHVRRISLNFAMFRRTFEQGAQIGATPPQRLFRKALLVASRWWQLESLYRANEKYHPQWQQRLLCYERGSSLSQVLIATGQAEGFLPAPGQRFFFRRGGSAAPSRERDATFVEHVQRQEVAADLPPATTRRLSSQERDRRKRLARLRDAGIDPYPVAVERTVAIGELLRRVDEGTTPDDGSVTESVVGRIVRARHHGRLVFLDMREGTSHIQAMMRRDHCRQPAARPERLLDLGDTISVTGEIMRTRTGELTVDVTGWAMAAKALVPMPDKRFGLTDPEAKLRLRHVDLALSGQAQTMMRARSTAVHALRQSLHRRDYIEVETPMLQLIHGGANARPFRTHINAYDADLYLRIAPELALKRLAVGGLQRVFEMGRNFRNEGADASHNPEFTSVEVYQAFADYTTMRHLAQELIVEAATAVHGAPVAHRGEETIDLGGAWPARTVHAAVSAAVGETITPDTALAQVRAIAAEHGVPTAGTSGEIVTELYERLVEPFTVAPTFYLDFPVETSPLTRPHRDDPRLAERWDLVAFGMELGTAYSELTDPIEQRERLTRQSLRAAAGDLEAMELDEDFLAALEFGLPPTGGLGLGVDRIVMAITGASIRQTLAFPFLRPAGH